MFIAINKTSVLFLLKCVQTKQIGFVYQFKEAKGLYIGMWVAESVHH